MLAAAVVSTLVGCDADTVRVSDAPAPAVVPPVDADLADGGWPEAAAWIQRANDDGRPVLVNIFASWCGPCEREMPLLVDAAQAHPEVAFLGIDHLDQRANAERFVEEQGIEFATIFDIAGDFAAAVEARGMPTTVVFDTDGVLVARHTGELTSTSLASLLDEVR